MPLSLQGVGLGEFWGRVHSTADFDWKRRRVQVGCRLESLHLRFPELPDTEVQDLAPAEEIDVGVFRGERFVSLPLQPVMDEESDGAVWTTTVDVHLGDDVWVNQGPTRSVRLRGDFELTAEEEPVLEGRIRLSRGRIDVNGRVFEVQEGTLTFQPSEPQNPILVAEAFWDSPADVRVIASFWGPVKGGNMSLRSEPPLPSDEVVSLLLFGDTRGLSDVSTGSSNNLGTGLLLGGRLATQGLNQALSRIEEIDISTRFSSDDSGNARPEVWVRLTNSLSAQVAYNVARPGVGSSPDRTMLTLELRLPHGNFLSTSLGGSRKQ